MHLARLVRMTDAPRGLVVASCGGFVGSGGGFVVGWDCGEVEWVCRVWRHRRRKVGTVENGGLLENLGILRGKSEVRRCRGTC